MVDPEEVGGGDNLKLHSDDEEEEKRVVGEEEEDDDDDDDGELIIDDVEPLEPDSDGAEAAPPQKKRERPDAETDAPGAKRARPETEPPPAAAAPAAQPESHRLTEEQVLHELRLRGGSVKAQDLLTHFKKEIKADPQNKERIKVIMRRLVTVEDDPIQGKILRLKNAYQ